MDELIIESYGKINLGLDILYKRKDSYHELKTIMQQISLKDIITIKEIEEGIVIESNSSDIPLDSTNLVYKAWDKLRGLAINPKGIHIMIHKEIPVAAGLAGGSTNAASVLKGLNEFWNLGLSEEDLRNIGKDLGADIPYCIMGGTALAEGIGEKLTRLNDFSGKHILLINPGIGISTEDVYSKLNLDHVKRMDIEKIIESIENDDLESLAKNMTNGMEKVVIDENPIIGEIKEDILGCGALGALMSGSGPTVFGLFNDETKLDFCKKKLSKKYSKGLIIKAHTI